jgi:hypothetical protein
MTFQDAQNTYPLGSRTSNAVFLRYVRRKKWDEGSEAINSILGTLARVLQDTRNPAAYEQ